MQGFSVVAYVNAERKAEYRRPVGADRIIKSFASTYSKAEDLKRKMEGDYDAVVRIVR